MIEAITRTGLGEVARWQWVLGDDITSSPSCPARCPRTRCRWTRPS
ncbi:hypothetical protein ACFQZC_19520 [Streptacidiphilus monticola]